MAQRTRDWGYGPANPEGNEKLALFLAKDAARSLAAGSGFHLAFTAPSRRAVDEFHAAALSNGGRDEGAPGERPHYGKTYYAAFILNPDGHKIEAVHKTFDLYAG